MHSDSNQSIVDKERKVKCTLIPGDGVGPELCQAVKQVLSAMSVPIEFEELFLR
jgi:probable isocitrate dehydrogenase [NAD] subunit beta, mitochondrial